MVRVKSLIARFNGGRVGGAHAEVEVDEAKDLSVLIVHDPADETVAEQLVDAIQPRLSVPVHTASEDAEAEKEAKNAEVALLLVSMALQDNWKLVEAAARVLPNTLVPILIDENMKDTKKWKGAIAWYIPGDLFINFCKPTKDAADEVMSEALAAKARAAGAPGHRSFHAFLSHEWGKDKWVHKMAIELALRLRDHDIDVWLDAQQVSGSIHGSMADGIDSSTVFLVLATKGYMQKINTGDRSDNCLKEFEYASNKRSNQTVVAALEPDMVRPATKWTGRFKVALARQTPVDISQNAGEWLSDEADLQNAGEWFSDEAVKHLADAIRMRIETPEASSDLTPLMCDIYPRLNPCSSEAWAKGKAEKFTLGTRSWIIDELCDWYNKKLSAVFILVGDGGVGKSVIMAELCHRGGALKTDEDVKKSEADERAQPRRKSSRVRSLWRRSNEGRQPISVAAYHFFRHDQVTSAAPKEALVGIAWQLCLSVPGFADALDSMSFGGIRDKPLADVFQTILVDPLNKLGENQTPQVVVLDALDECSKSDGVLRKVIRTWKDVMPSWISLVVSTRPEGEIQRGITNNSLDSKVLELKDEENFRDIEKHIEHLLCDMKDTVEQKDVASCAKILSKRSEGLFLWASFLPETLNRMYEEKRGGLLTFQDVSKEDAIPNGLGGMFEEYFERLRDKMGGNDAYQSLLTPIVAAREPLSVEQLSVILDKTKKKTKTIVGNARNLLYQGGDSRVALIHKRMADWLIDFNQSGNLGVDIEDGHVALAGYCSRSRNDVFSLRHAVFHLVKSGEHAEAFELLNDFAWLQSAISVGDDEAQRRATIGNLIRDCVELGIYFAPESDTPRFLSKAVHALSYDPNELASQVLARLGHESKDPLACSLQTPGDQPWLEPTRVTLAHPRDPLLHVLKGHSGDVNSVAINGDTIVSGSNDNTVRIWNATSGEEQHVLKGHSGWVLCVAIQDDTIVSGSYDKTVRIWKATSGEEQHVLEGHSWGVNSVAIQGDTIVSGSDDNTVRIWNATSGEEQHVLKGHSWGVNSVAIQGDTIVSGSYDKTVRIWNATSGEEQHVLEGHTGPVWSVAIQGDTIVSGSGDNTVRIWNATSGEEQHVLSHSIMGASCVYSVAIDGNIIVSGTGDSYARDNTVRIWNATSGEEQQVLNGHSAMVICVAIDGDTIVSGSGDKTVRIWNATSGEEQHVLKELSGAIYRVAIQGDAIVSQSVNGTHYWNARTGEARAPLDADEAKASTTPVTNTLGKVEKGTHVKLSEGIGFTTDHRITRTACQEGVYVVGDVSGMVHILHVRGMEPAT